MLKYCYNLLIVSLYLQLINLMDCKTIIESQLINSMSFNGSNYLKVLSSVEESLQSNHKLLKTSNNWTQNKNDIKYLRNYLSNDLPPEECQYLVISFGTILSNFIQCLLVNEVPFSVCLNCGQDFDFLYSSYKDLRNSSESKCPNNFLNSNKISLINTYYMNAINQWKDGNCDSMTLITITYSL